MYRVGERVNNLPGEAIEKIYTLASQRNAEILPFNLEIFFRYPRVFCLAIQRILESIGAEVRFPVL
jgi:hypothetical protein